MEVWKGVKGFECSYLISNLGRVKSLPKQIKMPYGGFKMTKERIMKPQINQYGYHYVSFWDNGKRKNIQIHRVVAFAFIPNPENKPQVNHINGIKINNGPENLEWCTAQENSNHAVSTGLAASGSRIAQSKLNINQVEEIKLKYSNGDVTYFDLAEQYNVSFSIIGQIVRNEIWQNKVI